MVIVKQSLPIFIAVKKAVERIDGQDIMIISGLALITTGIMMACPWLSFVVLGLALFGLGTGFIEVKTHGDIRRDSAGETSSTESRKE